MIGAYCAIVAVHCRVQAQRQFCFFSFHMENNGQSSMLKEKGTVWSVRSPGMK
jgi:hypothetical protein